MSDFVFRINPNIILGSYSLSRLGQLALEWGTRFMVILDPILKEVKIADKVKQSLDDRKVDYFVFNELSEGSTSKTVERALTLAKEGHVHGIIAVGGTSALNVGRAVAALFNEVHTFYTFMDGAQPNTNPIPCICVPSTYRTPFVFTNSVPITDSRSNQIKLMKVQKNLCKLVLYDPNTSLSLSANQKTTIAIELIAMAVEAYLSQKANFFSDMFVEKGLELLTYALDGSPSLDITTPEEILFAQAGTMISLATTSSSLGLSSMLSLTINSRYKMLKSLVSSILLPYMIEDVVKYKSTKIAKLAKIMKCVQKDEAETLSEEELCKAFIDSVRERIAKANLPTRLKDLNLTIEQLSLAVEDVKEIDIVNTLPRSMSTDDIFDFIKLAY